MKFYEFGDKNNPVVVLIPGTGCNWKGEFGKVIKELTEVYRIVCVSYNGHDDNDKNTFYHIKDQIYLLENFIIKNYNGCVYGVYGSSLGGSIVGKLIERNRIKIEVAITGSTDFEQKNRFSAFISSIIVVPLFHYLINSKKPAKIFRKKLDAMYGDYKRAIDIMYKNISLRSLFNIYFTDLVTPLEFNLIPENTKIYCTYGTKENTKILLKRYHMHFPKANLVPLKGLSHEELLISYPKEWVVMIQHLLANEKYKIYSKLTKNPDEGLKVIDKGEAAAIALAKTKGEILLCKKK